MKKYFIIILLLVWVSTMTSCEDFLNRAPYDSIDDTEYWQNEGHIRSYSYGFYPSIFVGFGTSGLLNGSTMGNGDMFNDDIAHNVQSEFTPIRIPESDGGWNFSNIRKANYMIEKTTAMTGIDEETTNHWVGVARFFRAVFYSNMVFAYGDVPWYDRRLSTADLNDMYKDRDPRSEVVKHIMEDFQFAMTNVRTSDGDLNVNRYVVAAMASRFMLREGTFLKYHNKDAALATQCITMARDASKLIIDSKKYSIADDYNALFSSDDLNGNPECIFYRKYLGGILTHCVLTYNNAEAQTGASRALMEAYLTDGGLPVHADPAWNPTTAADFFKHRDPRITATFRSTYYLRGEDCTPFNYSTSGYSMHKFMDDKQSTSSDQKFRGQNNETDCPVLRYAEVLLNYAEAQCELGNITQGDLDISINVIRSRSGVNMPALEVIGSEPAVGGVVYSDPKRDPSVSPILWEIRRERRVEMCFEGLRYNDLKRWKKLEYMCNEYNPDIRYGAYIKYADFPKVNKTEVYIDNGATEGYILCNRGTARQAPTDRNYVKPVPKDQIQLYKDNGFTLSQTKEWTGQ